MQTASRYPWGKGRIRWVRTVSTDDSDVTYTVPVGKIWRLFRVYCELTATAAVGNRILVIDITNGVGSIWTSNRSANIVQSTVGSIEYEEDSPSIHSTAVARAQLGGAGNAAGSTVGVLPEMYLLEGYTVHVYDIAAIAPAADDMVVVLHYIEYDA